MCVWMSVCVYMPVCLCFSYFNDKQMVSNFGNKLELYIIRKPVWSRWYFVQCDEERLLQVVIDPLSRSITISDHDSAVIVI